jgi:hypothetical protein
MPKENNRPLGENSPNLVTLEVAQKCGRLIFHGKSDVLIMAKMG